MTAEPIRSAGAGPVPVLDTSRIPPVDSNQSIDSRNESPEFGLVYLNSMINSMKTSPGADVGPVQVQMWYEAPLRHVSTQGTLWRPWVPSVRWCALEATTSCELHLHDASLSVRACVCACVCARTRARLSHHGYDAPCVSGCVSAVSDFACAPSTIFGPAPGGSGVAAVPAAGAGAAGGAECTGGGGMGAAI